VVWWIWCVAQFVWAQKGPWPKDTYTHGKFEVLTSFQKKRLEECKSAETLQCSKKKRDITAMQVHPASDATESICLSSIFSYSVTATTYYYLSSDLLPSLLPSASIIILVCTIII